MKNNSKSRKIVIGAILAGIVIAAATTTERLLSRPNLIENSRMLMPLDAMPGRSNCPTVDAGYLWIDDNRLIYSAFQGWTRLAVITADVRTGKTSEVNVPASIGARQLVDVSPDGKWLLWNNLNYGATPNGPVATSLDGLTTVAWTRPVVSSDILFLPDGDHCVSLAAPWTSKSNSIGVLVNYSKSSKTSTEFPITGISPFFHPLGLDGEGRILFVQNFDGHTLPIAAMQGPIIMCRVDLNGPRPLTAVPLKVDLPPATDANIGSVEVSPQGDRLLWWFQTPLKPTPWNNILRRFIHMDDDTMAVYVTDLQGHNGRELGEIGERAFDQVSCTPRWCPDGRHISFTWKNKLYRMEAQ